MTTIACHKSVIPVQEHSGKVMLPQNKTLLSVSPDMVQYARRHGARFDGHLGVWYIIGDLPGALFNLLPGAKKRPVDEVVPQCELCGAKMVKRVRRVDQEPFWGCSVWPGCKGSLSYEDYLDRYYPSQATTIAKHLGNASSGLCHEDSLEDMTDQVCARAVDVLGGEDRASKWLYGPMASLRGETPFSIMDTVDGCRIALFMLETFHDWNVLTTTAVPE
jgi:hypothetical protein